MNTAVGILKRIDRAFYDMTTDEDKYKLWITVFTWAVGIYVSVSVCVFGFLTTISISNSTKLAQLQAGLFDARDAAALREAIHQLKLQVAKLPEESPPRWFVEKVESIDKRLERVEQRK